MYEQVWMHYTNIPPCTAYILILKGCACCRFAALCPLPSALRLPSAALPPSVALVAQLTRCAAALPATRAANPSRQRRWPGRAAELFPAALNQSAAASHIWRLGGLLLPVPLPSAALSPIYRHAYRGSNNAT